MWGPLISMIAGALADKQKEDASRTQASADQHMRYAQQLNPRMDPAAYNAMKLDRDLEEARSQAFTQRLGAFLQSGLMTQKSPEAPQAANAQLRQPGWMTGDYAPSYGYGDPAQFEYPGSDFQLQTPRLLR